MEHQDVEYMPMGGKFFSSFFSSITPSSNPMLMTVEFDGNLSTNTSTSELLEPRGGKVVVRGAKPANFGNTSQLCQRSNIF
jgi:hypothetical protein